MTHEPLYVQIARSFKEYLSSNKEHANIDLLYSKYFPRGSGLGSTFFQYERSSQNDGQNLVFTFTYIHKFGANSWARIPYCIVLYPDLAEGFKLRISRMNNSNSVPEEVSREILPYFYRIFKNAFNFIPLRHNDNEYVMSKTA